MAAGPRALYNLVSRGGASPAASTRAVGAAGEWRVFCASPPWCTGSDTGSPAALRAFRPPCRRGPGHGSRLARLRTVCMKALKVVVETPHALRPWRGAGVLRTTAYTGGLTAGVGAWSCPLPSPAVRTAYVVRLVPARTRATVQRRPCERARVPVRLVNGITLAFRNVRPSNVIHSTY